MPSRYPVNKVVIWNGANQSELFEMEFSSKVKSVRLRKDRIVVVLETLIKVFSFDLNPLEQERFESCLNPLGLCAVSTVFLGIYELNLVSILFQKKLKNAFGKILGRSRKSHDAFS